MGRGPIDSTTHSSAATPAAPASVPSRGSGFAPIAHVTLNAPLRWLRAGACDLARGPVTSLFYGAVFALAGWAIHFVFQFAYAYAYGLTWRFLLVSPRP